MFSILFFTILLIKSCFSKMFLAYDMICSCVFLTFFFFFLISRKLEEQKPKDQKPKASENKPIMTEWQQFGISALEWDRM